MTTNDVPSQLILQQLIRGFEVTQCLYVAATLGIADLLKDGPMSSEELAYATATHAPSLTRILRLLSAAGFELTQLIAVLTTYYIIEAMRV